MAVPAFLLGEDVEERQEDHTVKLSHVQDVSVLAVWSKETNECFLGETILWRKKGGFSKILFHVSHRKCGIAAILQNLRL